MFPFLFIVFLLAVIALILWYLNHSGADQKDIDGNRLKGAAGLISMETLQWRSIIATTVLVGAILIPITALMAHDYRKASREEAARLAAGVTPIWDGHRQYPMENCPSIITDALPVVLIAAPIFGWLIYALFLVRFVQTQESYLDAEDGFDDTATNPRDVQR